MSTKPSKSFSEWVNSMHKNSPLYYLIKDDKKVKEVEKDEDSKESEEDKANDTKKAYLKYAQMDTTQINN